MNNQNNITRYDYIDENKNILFTKIRTIDHVTQSKSFYLSRQVDGQFIRNLENTRKVLYNLPEVLSAIEKKQTIYLAEGEKDVETLRKYNLVATTTHSTLYWSAEFTQILKNADVIILFDYDKAGYDRKNKLIQELTGNVKRLRCIDLPELEYNDKHGKDITDWFEQGNTLDEFMKLVNNSSLIEKQYKFKAIGLKQFVNMPLPKREMLLSPIIPSQGLAMIFAKRGLGKTFVALEIAFAVATGGTFLRWNAPEKKHVLYLDGEMPQSVMQERLRRILLNSPYLENYDAEEHFHLLTPDQQQEAMPDLSTEEGRASIDHMVEKADLIVIDNISCLFRTGAENDSESWQEIQSWSLDLRRRGKSVLFVHHASKSGGQRGTSKKEDILDTVIMLKQPEDYKADQGAHFEIIFDKARHFTGQDAAPFIVQLIEDENKNLHWQETLSTEESLMQQYIHLKAQGFPDISIQERLNRSKSQIETIKKKAKTKGLTY